MFAPINIKNATLKTQIEKYLIESYHVGYDLDNYFTNENQIIMFEKLLQRDLHFTKKWTKGFYVIPEDNRKTMYLSSYISKKSIVKRASRKIFKHEYYGKLTKGAKNLLQGYMIDYIQQQKQQTKEIENMILAN